MAEHVEMARHPDLIELRERYDRAFATPTAGIVEGLTLLAAVFLAASPWIVGFQALTAITVTNLIAGGALLVLALMLSANSGRLHGLSWVVSAIGAWTIIAPWCIAGVMDTTRTIWTNAFTGGAIVVLGLAMTLIGVFRVRVFRVRRNAG